MKEPGGQLGGEAPSPQVHPEATMWPKEPKESWPRHIHDALAVCRAPGMALLPYTTWHPCPSKIGFWEETTPPTPHWEILEGRAAPLFYIPILSLHFEMGSH